MWFNDLFWGKRDTFVGKFNFLVINDHLWGPSVHVDKSSKKIQAGFSIEKPKCRQSNFSGHCVGSYLGAVVSIPGAVCVVGRILPRENCIPSMKKRLRKQGISLGISRIKILKKQDLKSKIHKASSLKNMLYS